MRLSYVSRLAVTAVFLFSLTGLLSCDDDKIVSPDTGSLTVPSSPVPDDHSTSSTSDIMLCWSSADPADSSVRYNLYFGDSYFPPLLAGSMSDTVFSLPILEAGKAYYWRVTATNENGDTATSKLWRFSTVDCWQYPLMLGHMWTYEQEFSLTNIEPPEMADEFEVHWVDTVTVVILDRVVMPDQNQAYLFRFFRPGEALWGEAYFANRPDGFYFYEEGMAPEIAPAKLPSGLRLEDGPISLDPGKAMPVLPIEFTELSDNDWPARALAYPLELSSEWIYLDHEYFGLMVKEVLGRETVELPAGTFDAFLIEKWYDYDHDGDRDNTSDYYDHIADIGLVRREQSAYQMQAMTYDGRRFTADYSSIHRLIDYDLDGD